MRASIWVLAAILALAGCAKPAKRTTWSKAGVSATDLQHAEAECVTAAGVARAPGPYAGAAAGPSRDADFVGRGMDGYIACMESKGFTRTP